jgi:hypothetical protein
MMTDKPAAYKTSEEVLAVVQKFETCVFAPDAFHHREHLTVALCYLAESDEQAALKRLRSNLFRFLSHHRIEKNVYHETVTLFWLKRVRHFLEHTDRARELALLANDLIEECVDARLINTHFSKELLASEAARQQWVEPDLQALDF